MFTFLQFFFLLADDVCSAFYKNMVKVAKCVTLNKVTSLSISLDCNNVVRVIC